jgi:hypothetical protein
MIGSKTLRFSLALTVSVAVSIVVAGSGCNLPSLLIKGTTDGTREFTKERGTHFADPETVGPVIAAGTVTNEGFLYYVPDYEPLLMSAIFSNIAYGVGWLIADANKAEIAGDFDKAEKLQARAGILFGRALFYTKRMLRLRDDDFDEAMAAGNDAFNRWVDENFYEEVDAEPALIAGLGFLVAMIESDEGLAAAVDLPVARYLIEKSIELDPKLNGGQGLVLIGTIECTMPKLVGGRPELGLKLMQRAAAMDNFTNHGILVSMADRCAVALQDRKMFTDLLMKVIESGDIEEYRLTNKLARHQAERLLKQQDEFFYD